MAIGQSAGDVPAVSEESSGSASGTDPDPVTSANHVDTTENGSNGPSRTVRFARAAAPSLIWLVVRLIGLGVLTWLAKVNDQQVLTRLTRWDGKWLLSIASNGYNGVPLGLVDAYGNRSMETPLAFFPGYPVAVSFMRFVSNAGLVMSGLLVSLVAGLVLAHGLARLGELVPGGSRRAGLLLVALVGAAPMGVVWSMAYSEALFCACAVWALVAVLRRNWVLAGWCTALAGAVRPTAGALLAAVGLAALAAIVARRDGWQPWAGGLLAPFGMIGYLWFVAYRTGSAFGWFELQKRGWNSRFDAGAATLKFTREVLITGRSVHEVVTVAVLLGALVLLAVCIRRGVPWPLVVYAVGVMLMDLGSNGLMNSKARLLLPAFVLLVPAALALAERRPTTALSVTAAVTVVSAWFGGYALTGWPYAI